MKMSVIEFLLILSSFSLVIANGPFLPQSQQVMKQGESVDLVCGVDLTKIGVETIKDLYWGMPNKKGIIEKLSDHYKTNKISISVEKTKKVYKKLLIIKDLEKSDEKVYQCSLLTYDEFMASSIQLKLQEEEVIDKQVRVEIPRLPQPLKIKKYIGDTVDFTCGVDVTNINASIIEDIFWSKYDAKIEDWDDIVDNTTKYTVLTEKSNKVYKTVLKIQSLELSDAGEYDCEIAPFANAGFVLKLEVEKHKRPDPNKGIPTLSQNRYIVTQVDKTIQLTCGVDYNDVDKASIRDIQWRKPNTRGRYRKILNSNRISVTTEMTNKHFKKILKISKLQTRDTGNYQCRLTLVGGEIDGFTTHLVVNERIAEVDIVKTDISFLPQNKYVVADEGGTISFVCGLNLTEINVESVQEIQWERYRHAKTLESLENATSRFIIETEKTKEILKKTLTIKNLELSDQRNYICTIRTTVGAFPLRVNLIVKEHEILEVPFLPQDSHPVGFVGGAVDLICGVNFSHFQAFLIKDVTWKKFNAANLPVQLNENATRPIVQIQKSEKEFRKTLKIENLQYADAGKYICSALTRHKRFNFEVTLNVEQPPITAIPFVNQSQLVSRYEGDTVELICGFDSTKINSSLINDIFWTIIDGRKSTRISKNTARLSVFSESNSHEFRLILKIKDLESTDSRIYGCSVTTSKRNFGFSVQLKVKSCIGAVSEPVSLPDDEKLIILDSMIESLIFGAETVWYEGGNVIII